MIRIMLAVFIASLPLSSALAQDWERLFGQNSAIKEPYRAAIKCESEWTELWKRHNPSTPVPTVDFTREMVVAVFLGEKTRGGIRVELVLQNDPLEKNRLVVYYRELPPSGDFQTTVISRPFEIRRLPRPYATVDFAANHKVKAL